METCDICFEDKDKDFIIKLNHFNNNMATNKNINGHQMCIDCYKKLRVNKCPFCRCEIKTTKINVIEIQNKICQLKYKINSTTNIPTTNIPRNLPTNVRVYNFNYNIVRIIGMNGFPYST